ncbi:response regulator [Thalassotalea fusca]
MHKVLIVEDEGDIATLVERFFQASNFATCVVNDGAIAVHTFELFSPDLVILDITLPNKSGVQICQELRRTSDVPIIMLTAQTQEADRIKGLKVGADDYVCKPFSAPELVLRAQNILKRVAPVEAPQNDWLVDQASKTVRFQTNEIDLTIYEFSIFHLLFSSPGRIYSREQIIDFAFQHRDVNDRAIDSHIKNIRKRIKAAGVEETVIESVYGAGYRFKK